MLVDKNKNMKNGILGDPGVIGTIDNRLSLDFRRWKNVECIKKKLKFDQKKKKTLKKKRSNSLCDIER